MHALTKELAEVSNDIARTMAEAAAASLLAGLSGSPTTVVDATVDEQEGTCGGARDSDSAAIAEAAASSSTVPVGRSREDAQLEVERLKARQLEIFTLIRDKREVSPRMHDHLIEHARRDGTEGQTQDDGIRNRFLYNHIQVLLVLTIDSYIEWESVICWEDLNHYASARRFLFKWRTADFVFHSLCSSYRATVWLTACLG